MRYSALATARSKSILAAILVAGPMAATPLAAGSLGVAPGAALGGSYGLEVTLGGPCTPNELTVPGPTTSGPSTACVHLTASAVEVVGAGATFTAGRTIDIGNDFVVGAGVDFTAAIDPQLDPFAFVVDTSPADVETFYAAFKMDLANLVLDPADELHLLNGVAGDGTVLFRAVLLHNAPMNEDRLVLEARLDDGTYEETPPGEQLLIPAGSNTVELSWVADDGGGHLLVALNGVPMDGFTGLDNGDGRLGAVEWGAVAGTVAASTGGLYLDEYHSFH